MANLKTTNQLEYTGQGPLDSKCQPVASLDELNKIAKTKRYPGMTVTVMDDGSGKQCEYWLVGEDGFSGVWEKKISSAEITIGGDDIEK